VQKKKIKEMAKIIAHLRFFQILFQGASRWRPEFNLLFLRLLLYLFADQAFFDKIDADSEDCEAKNCQKQGLVLVRKP
jgi:hypothetical protein